jgi:plastocyanin
MHRTTQPTRATRVTRLVAGIAVALLAASACGDDTGSASTATTTAAHGHDTTTVKIGAQDYAFTDAPKTIPTGTPISFTNTSTKEVHELIAVKLATDDVRTAKQLVSLPQAELGALIGPKPAAVLVAPPGAAGFPAVGDGALHEPGRYLLICMIPIGADPAKYLEEAKKGDGPPQVPGGPPHVTVGMYAEVTVS